MSEEGILLEVKDGFAIITFNQPKKKNALNHELYLRLANYLREIDAREDVFLTIITGKGDFFSAGADVKAVRPTADKVADVRSETLARFTQNNANLARTLQSHRKILVAALNGPAIGLSATIVAFCDFVYAVENAWLLTPFSSLSLVAEGVSSLTFARRMGVSKANEALIMGNKISAHELHSCGFVNKLFAPSSDSDFRSAVVEYLRDRFSDLDHDAALKTKALIKATQQNPDEANLREVFAGAEQFALGRPQVQFARMAAKTKRHKM